MAEYLTKVRPQATRLPSRDQLEQIWAGWSEGGALWSTVVSHLMDSTYKACSGGFIFADKIDFDGTDGFTVRDTNMRATVQLTVDSLGTAATVEVATSWPLTPRQKIALEADKARVLAKDLKGQDLNGFVHMKYGTCEPSAGKKPEDEDLEARDPLDDLENTLDDLETDTLPAQRTLWTREDLVRSVRRSQRSAMLCPPSLLNDWTKSPSSGFHGPADLGSPYSM